MELDQREEPDSYFALRAEGTTFKVKRSILCRASAFFAQMLSIPQPAQMSDDEIYEGVPFVPVTESAEDVALFLRNIHNERYVISLFHADKLSILALVLCCP